MTVETKKVASGTYPTRMDGLEVWDTDMNTLPEGLARINSKGLIRVSDIGLELAFKLFPTIIINALKEDSGLELSVGESSLEDDWATAINQGGYALVNQPRLDYIAWLNAPNNERGGH